MLDLEGTCISRGSTEMVIDSNFAYIEEKIIPTSINKFVKGIHSNRGIIFPKYSKYESNYPITVASLFF